MTAPELGEPHWGAPRRRCTPTASVATETIDDAVARLLVRRSTSNDDDSLQEG